MIVIDFIKQTSIKVPMLEQTKDYLLRPHGANEKELPSHPKGVIVYLKLGYVVRERNVVSDRSQHIVIMRMYR